MAIVGGFVGVGNKNISELVEQLLDGQIVIPSIQRDYVWREAQIPPLLESIYRGYPIGAILVWQTTKAIPLKLAEVIQQKSQNHIPMVLLDGQQRITSLAWVWKPESRINGKKIDTRFDLTNERFLNPRSSDKSNKLLVPVRYLFGKNPNYSEILAQSGVQPDSTMYGVYMQKLVTLNNALTNYQIPVMSFSSDDYEEVSDVFARVNQGGRKLTKGDLINSAIAARWPEGIEKIETFVKKLEVQKFNLGIETPLRLMSLIAGKGGKHVKLIDKDMDASALEKAWSETQTALELGVDFLQQSCLVRSSSVLTSLNSVIVPALLLRKVKQNKSELNEAQLKSLVEWTYSVMAFSSYSSSIDTNLESDFRFIHEKDVDDALVLLKKRALGAFSAEGSISPVDLEGKTSASGLFNLLFINALRNEAKDWGTPIPISLTPMTSGFKVEYHHFFPRAQMKAKKIDKVLWDSLANLTFITAATNKVISDRLPALYLEDMKVSHDRLREQLIPTEAILHEVNNFENFLAERRLLQAQALNSMLGLKPYSGASAAQSAEMQDSISEEPEEEAAAYSAD